MGEKFAILAALLALSGCQLQSNEPTAAFTVVGNYQTVADCFFLKVRGEGMWDKDDLPSMKTVHVVLGTPQYQMGRVEFVGVSENQTTVTFVMPHSGKYEPQVRECAADQGAQS